MANQSDPLYDHVRPGELITAEKFNALIDRLAAIDIRISNLEGTHSNTPTITALEPANGPYAVGSQLIIRGTNFDVSIGGSRVFVDSVSMLPNNGSTDSQLLITIPLLAALPAAGKTVQLLVRNRVAEAARSILVQPAGLPLTGIVDIQWQKTEPAIIDPKSDTPIQFTYEAHSRTNRKATYKIRPIIAFPEGLPAGSKITAQQLQDAFSFRTPKGDTIDGLELDPSVPGFSNFVMQLDNVSKLGLPDKLKFTLRAVFSAEGNTWSSDTETFITGQEIAQPDASITVTVDFINPGSVDANTNTLRIPAKTAAALQLNAVFTQAGDYILLLPDKTGDWTIKPAQLTLLSEAVTDAQLKQGNGSVTRTPVIEVDSPQAGTTQLEFGYQGKGRPQKQTITLTLTVGN